MKKGTHQSDGNDGLELISAAEFAKNVSGTTIPIDGKQCGPAMRSEESSSNNRPKPPNSRKCEFLKNCLHSIRASIVDRREKEEGYANEKKIGQSTMISMRGQLDSKQREVDQKEQELLALREELQKVNEEFNAVQQKHDHAEEQRLQMHRELVQAREMEIIQEEMLHDYQ